MLGNNNSIIKIKVRTKINKEEEGGIPLWEEETSCRISLVTMTFSIIFLVAVINNNLVINNNSSNSVLKVREVLVEITNNSKEDRINKVYLTNFSVLLISHRCSMTKTWRKV